MRSTNISGLSWLIWAMLAGSPQGFAAESEFAQKPKSVDEMVIVPVAIDPSLTSRGSQAYFNAPIPRIIHQIWFGSPDVFDQERAGSWQQLAAKYGFAYHLWTEADDEAYGHMFGREIRDYIQNFRAKERFSAASDVLRYHLIEQLGGMYFDIDVPAPSRDGLLLDPADLWPAEGLVLAGENLAREVGNSAVYVQNHIMMAAPHHPVMSALTASILPNRDRQGRSLHSWETGPIFLTGQALLSRTIDGSFTMLPYPYLDSLNMHCWPNVPVYHDGLREAHKKRRGGQAPIGSIHREAPAFP